MLFNCGIINDRDIYYCDMGINLNIIQEFPDKNWLLFAIADKEQLGLLYNFAERCLDRNVLYVCGAGEACSEIDNAFDLVIVERRIASADKELMQKDFDDSPMTTWDHDFNEGFWFSVTTAYHETEVINKVVVANLTSKNYEPVIKNLVEKINSGWLPD